MKPASDKQVRYLVDLVEERIGRKLSTEQVDRARALSSAEASALIDEERRVAGERTPALDDLPEVPAGRYAVRHGDGSIKFYKVDCPTEGKWSGRVFVSIQAGDELHPVRNRAQRASVLATIADDPEAASTLYGREIGACGVCGRTLTNEESRERGIGPVCAEARGWA